PLPSRRVPPLLLPLPSACSVGSYTGQPLLAHDIVRSGRSRDPPNGGSRGNVDGGCEEMAGQRASGQHGREKKQDRSNLSKHVQEPAIGTWSGSRGDRSTCSHPPHGSLHVRTSRI